MSLSNTTWFLLLTAILIGSLLPVQGILLSKLGALLNHPIQATLVSYIGGSVVCLIILAASNAVYPSIQDLSIIDWRLYTAGFLGAIFVSGMLYLMPVVGVANMLAAAIVGQLIMAVSIDHFGWFGGLQVSVTPSRVLGVALLLVGLYFIQRESY